MEGEKPGRWEWDRWRRRVFCVDILVDDFLIPESADEEGASDQRSSRTLALSRPIHTVNEAASRSGSL